MSKEYRSLAEFYPHYLSQHQNKVCRYLHLVGSLLSLLLAVVAASTASWPLLIALPFVGYGFAWVGHFFFEKNRPATFRYPLYSFLCDWIMLRDLLLRRLK